MIQNLVINFPCAMTGQCIVMTLCFNIFIIVMGLLFALDTCFLNRQQII